jgi:hypothetical protein
MKARTPEASAEHLAKVLGIGVRTARRFKACGEMPFALVVMWAVLAEGDLGIADPAFQGWRLRHGQLFSPEGTAFRPGEIASIPLRMQQVSSMQKALSEPRQLMLTCS